MADCIKCGAYLKFNGGLYLKRYNVQKGSSKESIVDVDDENGFDDKAWN